MREKKNWRLIRSHTYDILTALIIIGVAAFILYEALHSSNG